MRFRTAQRKKMVAIAAALVACMMMAGCGASANTVDISSMEFNPQGKTIKQIAAALESGETTSRQLVSPDVYLEVQHPCWSCNSNSSSANASAGVR